MTISIFKKTAYSDSEIVLGLQRGERRAEDWFYKTARSYFNLHFGEVFFDADRKQEIFQSAFVKLWTEISNRKIRVSGNHVERQRVGGEYAAMTCSLTTFLMAFAKNENREIMRHTKDVYVEQYFDTAESDDTPASLAGEDPEEQKARIVDDCINLMSPHCVEIITLFYCQQKSLDEILSLRSDRNTTKTGLKSAKSKCMSALRERVNTEMKRYSLCC